MWIKIFYFYLFFCLIITGASQELSYSIEIHDESGLLNNDVPVFVDGASFVTFYDGKLSLSILDSNGIIEQSYLLSKKNNSILTIPIEYQGFNKWHLTSVFQSENSGGIIGYNGLVGANFENGIYWGIKTTIDESGPTPTYIYTNNKVFINHFWVPGGVEFINKLGFSEVDLNTGECMRSYLYDMEGTIISDSYESCQIIETSNGNLLILGYRSFSEHFESFLLKLSPKGNIINNVSFPVDSVWMKSICNDNQNNTYVVGMKRPVLLPFFASEIVTISKLGSNLSLIWTKQIDLENFSVRDVQVSVSNNGNIYIVLFSLNKLNTVILKISSTGEIVWQKAYNNLIRDVGFKNQAIFLASSTKDFIDGIYIPGILLMKINGDGDIYGCEALPSCLNIVDTTFLLTNRVWRKFEGELLPNFEVETFSHSLSSIPYCPNPNVPIPYFVFPDTLCEYSCMFPDSLVNSISDYNEWHILGPYLDTTIIDSSFYWCFDLPGTYHIEQTTWLLGCDNNYHQQVEVIANTVEASLGGDREICEELPFKLSLNINNTKLTYLWQDNSTENYLELMDSGRYSLTVSDGYCVDSASVSLDLIRSSMNEPLFETPLDTTICFEQLPLQLEPKSSYSQSFFLDGKLGFSNEVFFFTPGTYYFGFNYKGCYFEEKFIFNTLPCPVEIYIPNVFSPNYDGINDFIEPLGSDFIPLELMIFNRWGDTVFESSIGHYKWDGLFLGKNASSGIYVLHFKFRNLKTHKNEKISQEFLLLR